MVNRVRIASGELSLRKSLQESLNELSQRKQYPPRTVAAIDVGSNSIHVTVARVSDTNIQVLAAQKRSARLGAALSRHGELSVQTIDMVVEVLRDFKQLATTHNAVIRASATAALRLARNGDEVVDRVRDEAGVHVTIISEADEARLV